MISFVCTAQCWKLFSFNFGNQFFANLIKIFVFIYCLRCKMAGISHTTVNGSRWIAKIMTTDIEATATDKAMLLSNCGGLHFTINDESVHILWIFDCELPSTHLNGFEPSQYNVDVNIFFFSAAITFTYTFFADEKNIEFPTICTNHTHTLGIRRLKSSTD